MAQIITKRTLYRQAFNAVHNPPSATEPIKAAKHFAIEKNKMVKELVPFLMYLYKKYMDAKISESIVESYLQSRTTKHLTQLTEIKKKSSNQPEYKEVDPIMGSPYGFESPVDVEDDLNEDINIPLNVGDTVLGGKFKNKRIVVKSISKNEKGEITINGKPLLKYRLVSEANAVSGGKVNKYITGKNLTLKGKKYSDIEFEVLTIDNKSQLVKLKVLAPKDIFGQEMNVPFKTIRRGPFLKTNTNESSINEFGGVRFDAIGYDKNGKEVDMYLPRANNGFVKNIVNTAADKLFKGGKGVEYIEVYYDKHHLGTIKKPRTFTKGKDWGKLPINEIPMGDLQKIDQFADKQLNPVDVVLTDKHFFDRLNDPRNGKEISNAELIGFFKRLAKHKKEFVEFLNQYNSLVAVDDRTNINIPFMKQANKAIAKTVMRKKDFKTPDKKLDI